MSDLQPHLKIKKGDIAPYVLLPGDPGRIKEIIKYWDEAKQVSNNREFLTYTGKYKNIPISATSTGIGCPSTAIAIEELIKAGAKVFIRIGTCGALRQDIKPGDLIIPSKTINQDGTTSEYVDKNFEALPNKDIFDKLICSAQELNFKYFTGTNRTHDAFYESTNNFLALMDLAQYKNGELISSEMECSIVFTLAKLRGLKAGAVLAVNTSEPLEQVAKNPDIVYGLETNAQALDGVDNAIQTVLKTIEKLENK